MAQHGTSLRAKPAGIADASCFLRSLLTISCAVFFYCTCSCAADSSVNMLPQVRWDCAARSY